MELSHCTLFPKYSRCSRRHMELWQKPLAPVGSHYTEGCWHHEQEEAFCALVQALPLLTCFLPSQHEVQHHVRGVPCCEWFLGKQALFHTHTCLTKVFTIGGPLRATTEFPRLPLAGLSCRSLPLCSPPPDSDSFKLKKRLLQYFPRVSSFS